MSKKLSISKKQIENRIFTIRGAQVMVDYHLAELYSVETKRINEQVKRNVKRFPENFMFQITKTEWENLKSQIATTENENGLQSQIATAKRRTLPYVFTEQGVFFDGQVFDAYELTSKIIRSAKKSIVLIDNYMNENTLTHLAKKNEGVTVLLLTKTVSKQLTLDVQHANKQYGGFELKSFAKSHDRFLIIDGKEVYHLGASLKDLGKSGLLFLKWIRIP